MWVPALFLFLLLLLLLRPGFVQFSETGSAALHAPMLLSLAAGLFLGYIAVSVTSC